MIKTALLFITFFLALTKAFAQGEGSELFASVASTDANSLANNLSVDKNRIYYGGYLNMNFGKYYSIIGAQPLVAYKINPKLSVGTQLSFEYISDSRYAANQNGANYGASIFSRYRLSPYFYVHSEFSLMSYKWFYNDGSDERKLAPMLYVGGGLSQPVSENVWINAQVLFDVLNHENSPYKEWEPYYSIGFGVGF